VVSEDAVTATVKEIDYEILFRMSKRITDKLPTVVRCLYDVTDKPPSTIEFE
jgi:GMP synthase (glutamine-hydrolysing)